MENALRQKLEELKAEASREGQWPVVTVLHMLLGAYNTGQQKRLARHVAQFSSIRFDLESQVTDRPDEFLEAMGHNQYRH